MGTNTKSDHSHRNTERLGERVGIALGIVPSVAMALLPFDPRQEAQAGRGRGRKRRGPYMKRADVDARLAPYARDAAASVPDAMLAQRAGVSVEQVRQWRRRHQLEGRRGRPPPGFGATYLARSLLGEEVPLVPHAVSSPVGGTWRPPVYLLRQPLEYDLFAEVTAALLSTYSAAQVSRAIGIAERDVLAAARLHEARGKR